MSCMPFYTGLQYSMSLDMLTLTCVNPAELNVLTERPHELILPQCVYETVFPPNRRNGG